MDFERLSVRSLFYEFSSFVTDSNKFSKNATNATSKSSKNVINLRENEFAKTYMRLLKETYASDKSPYMIQGVVFTNMDLDLRAKYINPNYETVRKLRGNQAQKLYRYLELNMSDKVSEYLKYYSEEGYLFTYE